MALTWHSWTSVTDEDAVTHTLDWTNAAAIAGGQVRLYFDALRRTVIAYAPTSYTWWRANNGMGPCAAPFRHVTPIDALPINRLHFSLGEYPYSNNLSDHYWARAGESNWLLWYDETTAQWVISASTSLWIRPPTSEWYWTGPSMTGAFAAYKPGYDPLTVESDLLQPTDRGYAYVRDNANVLAATFIPAAAWVLSGQPKMTVLKIDYPEWFVGYEDGHELPSDLLYRLYDILTDVGASPV